MAATVGFLIARVGLNSCGLYTNVPEAGGYVFGDFSQKSTLLGLIGVIICFILTYVKFNIGGRLYKIKGGLLIGIILTTIIGIPMGVTQLPDTIFTSNVFSSIADMAFRIDIIGALKLSYIPLVLMLLINDFFGTLGAGLALAGKAKLMDEDGNFPAFGKVFLVDASATVLGSLFGISTVSCFAESAAGIESGSRTGLSNISTGFCSSCAALSAPVPYDPRCRYRCSSGCGRYFMIETINGLDTNPWTFSRLPVCGWSPFLCRTMLAVSSSAWVSM